jgi:hypothetical protein
MFGLCISAVVLDWFTIRFDWHQWHSQRERQLPQHVLVDQFGGTERRTPSNLHAPLKSNQSQTIEPDAKSLGFSLSCRTMNKGELLPLDIPNNWGR